MKYASNPSRNIWASLVQRPQLESDFLESSVRNTINRVRSFGDDAIRELTLQFDKVKTERIEISEDEISAAPALLSGQLKAAILVAAENIRKFHALQKREVISTETTAGVLCWRKSAPIQKVGIYIPGGSAPLFSTVLMLSIPAQLAGCQEIILCSPPDKSGNIHPAILFAASLSGIKKIFRVGGAQAIAAMAYGTSSIPPVYKIFGPGNQFVTKAKQMVAAEGIAIDMPAGPSEVMVIADESADAEFVAADLLSQAEHGPDSQVILLSDNESKIADIISSIEAQLDSLPRKEIAKQAMSNSLAIFFNSKKDIVDFANEYAAEHLIINTTDCEALSENIVNAGSVFLGAYSPESVGDYASGTNHTLPTNGFARAYSGVSLESFSKTITFQKLSESGIKNIGPYVEVMAEAEQLEGHKRAVTIRLNKLK